MPAPDDLKTQSPGDPLASADTGAAGGNPNASESSTAQAQPPLYVAKHIAGGRWHVVTNDAEAKRVGDFVGDKVSVLVELDRLIAGGEPLKLDPERNGDRAAQAQAKPSTTNVDPTTLKQAVMTPDGWLCPEPPAKE
jgi:hypothetical protein